MDLEQTIRERAYQLWAEGGRQDGHADLHWLAAQREILSASLGEIERVAKPKKADKPKADKPKAPRKKRAA